MLRVADLKENGISILKSSLPILATCKYCTYNKIKIAATIIVTNKALLKMADAYSKKERILVMFLVQQNVCLF